MLREGLQEIPDGGCVIFISRADLPLSMARFRANQAMEFIGPEQLKLTREESDAIVELRGHKLSTDALQQLYEKTEGWAAGLVLMLGRADAEGAVEMLPADSTPEVVFDYLAGEIFKNFEPATQDFLLKTAWMPQITVSMGQQLSGEENAGEILNNLARNDYFVTSKQNVGELVYQYHPLLREFLLSKAEETLSADERNAIQAKGAALFEAEGQIEETMALRVDARNWDEISRIIRENAADMLDQGRGKRWSTGWRNSLRHASKTIPGCCTGLAQRASPSHHGTAGDCPSRPMVCSRTLPSPTGKGYFPPWPGSWTQSFMNSTT